MHDFGSAAQMPSEKQRLPRVLIVAAFLVLAFGIGYRLWFIDYRGYWLDELWSLNNSGPQQTVGDVVNAALRDRHPPLWDVLLHGWMCAFPGWALGPRYLSLLLGIAGIGLVPWYSWLVWRDKLGALVCMTVMALAFLHILHTTEARYYGLLTLLAGGFAGQLLCSLQQHNKTRALTGMLLFGIPLVYTHIYGAILVFAVGMALAAAVVLRRLTVRQVVPAILVCVLIGASLLPIAARLVGDTVPVAWIPRPPRGAFVRFLYYTVGNNPIDTALLLICLLYVLVRFRRVHAAALVCAWGVVFCFLIPFAVSRLWAPMLVTRYTIVYLPLLCLIAGYAVSRRYVASPRVVTWALPCLWAVSILNLLFVHPYGSLVDRPQPWGDMAATLDRQYLGKPHPPVYSTVDWYFNYYQPLPDQKGVRPLSELDPSQPTVLFLQTPYEVPAAHFFDSLGYRVAGRQSFGDEWQIVRYTRP